MSFDFRNNNISDKKAMNMIYYASMLIMLDAAVIECGALVHHDNPDKQRDLIETGIVLEVGALALVGMGLAGDLIGDTISRKKKSQPAP